MTSPTAHLPRVLIEPPPERPKTYTVKETAYIMGISRQRVEQYEKSALAKLRAGLMEFWEEGR